MPGSPNPKSKPANGRIKNATFRGIFTAFTRSNLCAASKTPRKDVERKLIGREMATNFMVSCASLTNPAGILR